MPTVATETCRFSPKTINNNKVKSHFSQQLHGRDSENLIYRFYAAVLTLVVGGSGAKYSGVMYRSPTDEIMLDIAAAADDTESDVAAAAAAAAAAEAAEGVVETGGEVEPLGDDASPAEGGGPFAGGGCSSIVIEGRTSRLSSFTALFLARTCQQNDLFGFLFLASFPNSVHRVGGGGSLGSRLDG